MEEGRYAKQNYRKVVANLQSCEERYKTLVESISDSDDARLKAALSTLKSESRRRRQLEAELLEAVETERERIGRDLHDDLCQRLGAAAMMTAVVAKRVARQDAALAEDLEKIPKLINDTIESCRTLARGLHPTTLSGDGLPAALDELASRMPAGIKFGWPKGERIEFEPSVALHLYRIIEEAVGNAVKHSGAKEINIKLDVLQHGTVLVISDDGQGFDLGAATKGMGLRNIHFRANAIGAELTIEARETGGTRVQCRLRAKAKSEAPAARQFGVRRDSRQAALEGAKSRRTKK